MVAFAAIALGMIVARAVPAVPPVIWWAVGAGACASAALLRGRSAPTALAIGAVALGASTFASRVSTPPDDALSMLIAGHAPNSPLVLTVEGLALETPRPPALDAPMSAFGSAAPSGSFSLRAGRVLTESGWAACDSTMWCRVPGTTYSSAAGLGGFGVRAGQLVRLTGIAEPVRPLDNPGQPDARLYAAQGDVAGSLRVDSPALVVVTSESPRAFSAWLAAALDALHSRAMLALDPGPRADPASRALILSLFLGQSEPGERELRDAFTRLGLAHVLAISGVHVVVMAGVGLFLLRLTGERGTLEPLAVALLVIIYLLAVPASAPVVRAGVITLVLLIGEALGRRYDRLALIAWCACALVLWRPLDLWSLGFQLSFGLTALLLWLGRRAHDAMFGPKIRGLVPVRRTGVGLALVWAWDRFKLALSASALCWSAGVPLIAFRTGLLSPLAVLTSLVTLPAITLLMWAGYVTLIAGLVWPAAAHALHPLLTVISSVCVALVRWLDQLPLMAVRVPPISIAWTIAATALVLAWFMYARLRSRACLAAAAALAVWLGAEWAFVYRGNDDRVRLDALALGDGSCTLLRRDGACVLWNAGSSRLDAGQRLIPSALRALGAWRIPTIVLASPSLHDLSAVPDLVEPLGVKTVLFCGPVAREAKEHPESGAAWLAAHLKSRHVEVRTLAPGATVPLGDALIEAAPAAPDPASPWLGIVRDTDGAPLALLAESLDATLLRDQLTGAERLAPRIIESGPESRASLRTDAIILTHRDDDPALDSRTLAIGRRAAWARVTREGRAEAGRHEP